MQWSVTVAANRWMKFTTGRGTYGSVAQAVRICALAVLASVAAASCTVIHKEPQPTMATWTFSVCGKEVETIRVRWNYESPVEATGPETKEAR